MHQMRFVAPVPLPLFAPVEFSGERGAFRRLVARGAVLELITAGFYRFWLATDIRRHLWTHTLLDGDAFEYTGRAKELLIGFLFALAILVPVYLAYFLVGLEAERLKTFASAPLFIFFYLFGQFAIFRARRYRLTRTVWRGVRFWMAGSGLGYAARAALWGLLMVLTLGLILPWREAALERYKMQHTYYGDLQGSFEGRGWEFFKRGWWLWLLIMVPIVLVSLTVVAGFAVPARPATAWSAALVHLAGIASIVLLVLMVGAPFLYGLFKAVEWRWWLSGIRFGELRLQSTLRRGVLIGLYWKMIGWYLLLSIVLGAYVGLSAYLAASLSGVPISQFFAQQMAAKSVLFLVLAGIGYLAAILTMNVAMRVYLLRDLWARVVASTEVMGIEAAADVAARGELSNALGEGFADGLDVAGF
jgi:uncharacterized membrane protein YjgN (DUF898 family)